MLFNKKSAKPDSQQLRLGFVLLNTKQVNWDGFIRNLQNDWSIAVDDTEKNKDILIFKYDGMTVTCVFVDVPVPNDEAVENAKNNYLWRDAVQVSKAHTAQIVLTVLDGDSSVARSLLYTKAAASLLKLDNATAIYQYPTVISRELYLQAAQDIKDGALPVLVWVYFGIYPDGNRFSGYTFGLDYFDMDEIEILKSKEPPDEIYHLLVKISMYVLENNVMLKHGETLGFSSEQKLKITRSKGISVDKESLKIAF